MPSMVTKRRQTGPVELQPNGDCRCSCHRLLARVVPEGVELSCPRCKGRSILTRAMLREALRREPDTVGSS